MSVANLGLSASAQGGVNIRSSSGTGVLVDNLTNTPGFTSNVTQAVPTTFWTANTNIVLSTFKTVGAANWFTLTGTLNFTLAGSTAPTVTFFLTSSPTGANISTILSHGCALAANSVSISLTSSVPFVALGSPVYLVVNSPSGATPSATSWSAGATFTGTTLQSLTGN